MLNRLNLLFRFKAIAESGSLRRAAETLNITQPALSRSLRQLEQYYGKPLFERHARGVRPTRFGERLLSTISRIARDWEVAETALSKEAHLAAGTLRLNVGPLWGAVVLPVVVSRLQEIYPNLVTEICSNTGDSMVDLLLEGRIDIAFGGLHALESAPNELLRHRFTTIRDRIVARAGHPIHACDPGDYEAVLAYPWVIYTSDPVYEAETLHIVIERTGAPPRIRVRSRSLIAVLRLLQEGNYLCMLPDAAAAGIPGLPVKPIPIDLGRRGGDSGALYRKAMINYPPVRTVLDLCEEYFAASEAAP